MRLVTTSGKTYEICSGVASSFVQILAAMNVKEDASGGDVHDSAAAPSASADAADAADAAGAVRIKADPDAAAAARAAHASAATATATAAAAAAPGGSVHFMGSITKKLVVTPEYEIGDRRQRSFSTTSVNSQQHQPQSMMEIDSATAQSAMRGSSSRGAGAAEGSYLSGTHVQFADSTGVSDSDGKGAAARGRHR